MSTFGFHWSPFKALLVLLALTACVYLGALSAPFFWDDDVLIRDNVHIRSLDEPTRFFLNPFWELVSEEHKERAKPNRDIMYRPLVMLSFAIDYYLYGKWAPGYHLTNLLLHLAVLVLAYSLALVVLPDKDSEVAALALCFFALHPALTQAVTWISGRSDLLCALFLLFGILAYRQCEKNSRPYLGLFLASLSMFLALLTKEVAITFPILLLLTYPKPLAKTKRLLSLGLALLPPVVAYGALKKAAASGSPLWDSAKPLSLHLIAVVRGVGTIFRYFLRLLYPFNLRLSYPEFSQPDFTYGPTDMLLFVVLLFLVLWALRGYERSQCSSFPIFWFIVPLLPVANVVLFKGLWTQYAERYLYIPSLFIFLSPLWLLRHWLHRNERKRAIVGRALLCLLMMLAFLTMYRNSLFQEPRLLWENELVASPDNKEALANLAITLCRQGHPDKGLVHLQRLCQLSPRNPLVWNNRLMAAVDCGDLSQAQEAYTILGQLVPHQVTPALNFSLLLIRQGNFTRGRRLMEEVLKKRPNNQRALRQLAICLIEEKRLDEARAVLSKLLSLYPQDVDARKLVAATGASLTN